MDASNWISFGGAGFAGVAAGIAGWQAASAKRSASAADKQARAAEQQVGIMERQLANETEARDHAAGPQFRVTKAVITDSRYGQREAHITVEQDSGAALSQVTVSTRRSEYVHNLLEWNDASGPITWTDTAPGSTYDLRASLEYNYVEPVNVVLDFECTEAHGTRTWRRTITAVPQPEPPPPGPARLRWVT